jgi:hypothetical protein
MRNFLPFLLLLGTIYTQVEFSIILAQSSTCSCPTDNPCVTFYLDVDGDNYGIDAPGLNIYYCTDEAPVSIEGYTTNSIFDEFPKNRLRRGGDEVIVEGCIWPDACNYNVPPNANKDNGTCKFPSSCEECEPNNPVPQPKIPTDLATTYPYNASGLEFCSCDISDNTIPLFKDAAGECGGSCESDFDGDLICDDQDRCPQHENNIIDACGACHNDSLGGNWAKIGAQYVSLGKDSAIVVSGAAPALAPTKGDECGCQSGEKQLNECMQCVDILNVDDACDADELGAMTDTIPTTAYWQAVSSEGADNPDFVDVATYLATGGNGIDDDEDREGCRSNNGYCNYDPNATFGLLDICDTVDVCNDCGGDAAYTAEGDVTSGFVGDNNRCSCTEWVEFPYQNKAPYDNCDEKECVNDVFPSTEYWDMVDTIPTHPDYPYVGTYQSTGGNGTCDELEIYGCKDSGACNYNSSATAQLTNEDCDYLDIVGTCGGSCELDADNDGICDDNDTDICVSATYDDCNNCGGTAEFTLADGSPCEPGSGVDCLNRTVVPNECNCAGDTLDVLLVCGGGCSADADNDNICDDVDDCVGTLDALGVCNGTCDNDIDSDGICDDVDIITGVAGDDCTELPGLSDDCDTCNGDVFFTLADGSPCVQGSSKDCLNRSVTPHTCDCAGNELDAINICGGDCQVDNDGDGICDDHGGDDCTGSLDDCAVCNGTTFFTLEDGSPCDQGSSEDCLDRNASPFRCNCFGDTLDALGVCGGPCLVDLDDDGICDIDKYNNVLDDCIGEPNNCGVCGIPDHVEGDGCDCECQQNGWCDNAGNVMDECGDCGGSGPLYCRDCQLNLLYDLDNDGICDLIDTLVIEVLEVETKRIAEQGRFIDLNPYRVDVTVQQFVDLHDSMSYSLEKGSLSGVSKSLTVQDSIINYGSLSVSDSASFDAKVDISSKVHILGDAKIEGDFQVAGTTFNNGGLRTNNLNNSGDLDVNGTTEVGLNLNVSGESIINNGLSVAGNFNVHNGTENGAFDLSGSRWKFIVNSRSGATTIRGNLGIQNSLIVREIGDLRNGLSVNGLSDIKNVHSSGALDAQASLGIGGNFNVNSGKFLITGSEGHTSLAGDLHIEGNMNVRGYALIKKSLRVLGMTFAKGGMETSSLDMTGNMTIDRDFNVGNDLTVAGLDSIKGKFSVGNQFRVNGTGGGPIFEMNNANIRIANNLAGTRLRSSGGATVGGKFITAGSGADGITIHGNADISGLTVTKKSTFNGSSNTLNLSGTTVAKGLVTVANNFIANAPATFKNLTNSGGLETQSLSITETNSQTGLTAAVNTSGAAVKIENANPNGHGVRVEIKTPAPNNESEFVRFYNNNGVSLGRIEGETPAEHSANLGWVADKKAFEADYRAASASETFGHASLVAANIEFACAVADQVGAALSLTGCFGWGFCISTPIPSLIIEAAVNIGIAALIREEAQKDYNRAKASLARSTELREIFISNSNGSVTKVNSNNGMVGVAFASGSGDYAEYLPKADTNDVLYPGQIVGLIDGKVSLRTQNAENLFVISTQPIVLGKTPDLDEDYFVKAAFMGQVPVHVLGPVEKGDYILPSGQNDGFGVAVKPQNFTASELRNMLGIAWTSSRNPEESQVLVAVGVSDGVSLVASELNERINSLDKEVDALDYMISMQMTNRKMSVIEAQKAGLLPAAIRPQSEIYSSEQYEMEYNANPEDLQMITSDDIVTWELTPEAMDYAFELALKDFRRISNGKSNVLKKLDRDPKAKAEFLEMIRTAINEHNQEFVESIDYYNSLNILEPMTATLKEKPIQKAEKRVSKTSNKKRQ